MINVQGDVWRGFPTVLAGVVVSSENFESETLADGHGVASLFHLLVDEVFDEVASGVFVVVECSPVAVVFGFVFFAFEFQASSVDAVEFLDFGQDFGDLRVREHGAEVWADGCDQIRVLLCGQRERVLIPCLLLPVR